MAGKTRGDMRAFRAQHEKVDTFIRSIGGYWAPLGALARVTEELGEFAEAAATGDVQGEAEEITDLFVIVSTITNQYCAWPSADQVESAGDEPPDLARLARALGPLARLMNQFEGIKPPKKNERTADITEVIARIYALLDRMARSRGVQLEESVLKSAEAKGARDANRFTVRSFDPVTARSLDAFRAAMPAPLAQWAADARLWGEPSEGEAPEDGLAALRVFHAARFLRISGWHRLDGFVGSEPAGASDADHIARARERLALWNSAAPDADVTGHAGVFGGKLFTVMRLAGVDEKPSLPGALLVVPR